MTAPPRRGELTALASNPLRKRLQRLAAACGLALAALAFAPPAAAEEDGPTWRSLTAEQRSVLEPLEREWPAIDARRKQKWLEIAARYPKLPPGEQQRLSARMNAWASMTPAERNQARLNYQEARQLSARERQARWEAYQALSPEEKRRLATRAVPPADGRPPGAARPPRHRDASQDKSNLVPGPSYAVPRKPVGPSVVQARPGATTTMVDERPSPPTHQQPGLPKIAATPGFVDKSTLLPRRGPQAAAVHSPKPSKPSDGRPVPAR